MVWISFGLLWSIVAAAVILLSRSLVQLDEAERSARQAGAIEENLRLALWRLDTIYSPLLAQQALMVVPADEQGELVPSTDEVSREQAAAQDVLLTTLPLTSSFRSSSRTQPATNDHFVAILKKLDEYSRFRSTLVPAEATNDPAELPLVANSSNQSSPRGLNEFVQRSQNFERNQAVIINNSVITAPATPPTPLTALWFDDSLLLVRRHRVAEEVLEGWKVDWASLRRQMQHSIADLLPEADLQPIRDVKNQSSPDMLATLPCLLVPGTVTGILNGRVPDRGLSVWAVLAIVWTCVLVTMVASGSLLYGLLRLGDQRAEFVAAVTHELRTPLTTLQLYSDMLCGGMIQDQATRQDYLVTLRSEVERIVHLVENVFAFSRIERGRLPGTYEPCLLRSVIDRSAPRLSRLCERNAMALVVEPSCDWDECIRADYSLVEQILVNLVDNASKHAASATDRRIHLSVTRGSAEIRIVVSDHGPGFTNIRRWSKPFSKTVQQAAETAPGIGLGLSISRRFANQMGGRLMLENSEHGAVASLVLPLNARGPLALV